MQMCMFAQCDRFRWSVVGTIDTLAAQHKLRIESEASAVPVAMEVRADVQDMP